MNQPKIMFNNNKRYSKNIIFNIIPSPKKEYKYNNKSAVEIILYIWKCIAKIIIGKTDKDIFNLIILQLFYLFIPQDRITFCSEPGCFDAWIKKLYITSPQYIATSLNHCDIKQSLECEKIFNYKILCSICSKMCCSNCLEDTPHGSNKRKKDNCILCMYKLKKFTF
jgi:hypothetical protein